MNTPGHTRYIVGCITLLGLVFGLSGSFLVYKGFEGGNIAMTIGGQCAAGLVGFLGGKMMTAPLNADGTTPVAGLNKQPIEVTETPQK